MTSPFLFTFPNEGGVPAGRSGEAGPAGGYICDHCGGQFEGPPASSGLFIWTRGDEVRFEEPPLCEQCAMSLTLGALQVWQDEDDEEG